MTDNELGKENKKPWDTEGLTGFENEGSRLEWWKQATCTMREHMSERDGLVQRWGSGKPMLNTGLKRPSGLSLHR